LQEYFASRGVIDEADAAPERGVIGCLRGYYFHPQWSEVVRLVAAQLAPPLAESLLASVLDDPDPVGRFLRRGPLLVLRCLADGTSIANRRFISGIFDSLAELGKSRWLGITLEVMEAFSDLQGTRWEEPANLARETILESAAGGLDAEEYRCLHCACALEGQIANDPVLAATLKSWLQSPDVPGLARVGAQLLARAMAHEKLDWDHEVIEKAESLLMSVEDPCPCALDSLRAIATAREVRHGLRLESVLRDSLRPLADSIELAFVFGSTARNRQVPDSDIDLFILGSATLKSLSGPLRQAEKVLGRRVNPAIYTRDSFRERYQRGDPFLLDVYRREKLPVIRKSGENLQTELEDELRAMVAERVASTA
jgi:predicted nucleotidyltransferase